MKRIIFILVVLLAIGLSQAQQYSYEQDKRGETLDTITGVVYGVCVVQNIASSALGLMGKVFIPKEAQIGVYLNLPQGRRIRLNKHLLRLKHAACPFVLEGLQRLR